MIKVFLLVLLIDFVTSWFRKPMQLPGVSASSSSLLAARNAGPVSGEIDRLEQLWTLMRVETKPAKSQA